ncbi:hypothetical protein LJ361_13870 [Brucella sp. JSBI001]|nr:hypothetical protein [Brucella sp. JSBI001]UZD68248.1 hypothetical protein LJ361_13870 [Brucella sp. JSBI001]
MSYWVRDTGIGMTKSEVEQAQKPFRQVSALERLKSPRPRRTGAVKAQAFRPTH